MTSGVPTYLNSLILHGVNPTGKEIGRGAYGRVFEVDYEGTLCAAKEVHALLLQYAQEDDLQKIKDDFLSECQIWSTLRHPCVVQFLGVYYPTVDQYRLPVMVMEKMQHSLRSLVENYDNIPLNVKLSILDEVCLGLRYLHSRNPPIVHRDLTPNNILLSYRLEAKITDLGVAKVMQTTDTKTMTKAPGTTDFMPPECLADRPVYGVPLDVFSYGGVILYTITQLWPQPSSWVQFEPDTGRRVYLSEMQRRQRYLDKMTGDAAKLKPLVMSCLDDNPIDRPVVSQISMMIRKVKDECSEKSGCDRMSPIIWWAQASSDQQVKVTSSLTTALEEMTINNEQLRREVDVLKTNNTQLRTDIDVMRDEIIQGKEKNKQLTTLLDKMAINNEKQMQQINFQSTEIETLQKEIGQLKTDVQQPKISTAPGDLFSGPMNIKWVEGTPAPVGRVGHTAVWLNGLVYVGGASENRHMTKTVPSYTIDCYDPVSNLWGSHIESPYSYFAMTVLNGNLLIAGGEDKDGKKTNQILIVNAGQLKKYTKMLRARTLATAIGHQGMLIITGGVDDMGKALSSTDLFDSVDGQWYTCMDLPQPLFELQSVIVDNILYLLGGYKNGLFPSKAVFTAPMDTLPQHRLKWNAHKDTPWCWSAPMSVHDTHLLIVGGINQTGTYAPSKSSDACSSHIYKLNMVSHRWETIGRIPSGIYSSIVVGTADNKIIVVGGWNNKRQITNTVWIGSCEPQYT